MVFCNIKVVLNQCKHYIAAYNSYMMAAIVLSGNLGQ